jgi:hypothetical protein
MEQIELLQEIVNIVKNSGLTVKETQKDSYQVYFKDIYLGYVAYFSTYNRVGINIDVHVEMVTKTKFNKNGVKSEVKIKVNRPYKKTLEERNAKELENIKTWCNLVVIHLKTAFIKKRKIEIDTEFEQ